MVDDGRLKVKSICCPAITFWKRNKKKLMVLINIKCDLKTKFRERDGYINGLLSGSLVTFNQKLKSSSWCFKLRRCDTWDCHMMDFYSHYLDLLFVLLNIFVSFSPFLGVTVHCVFIIFSLLFCPFRCSFSDTYPSNPHHFLLLHFFVVPSSSGKLIWF